MKKAADSTEAITGGGGNSRTGLRSSSSPSL